MADAVAAVALLLSGLLVAAGQGQAEPPAGPGPGGDAKEPAAAGAIPAVAGLVEAGEGLYAWHCAVCHGATGGGIEEARLSFPADERRCTRCHRPSNPAVQSLANPIRDNDMFSIGEPPPLRATPERPQAMAAVASAEALHAYLASSMPRYDPGRLTDEEYWALTAYLLMLNGRNGDLLTMPQTPPR